MKYFLLRSLPVLFFFYSCTSKEPKSSNPDFLTLSISDAAPLSVADLEIIDLFPLETNAQNLMGNDLRIRKSTNKIYVMDIAQRDGIHVFSASGQFLKNVAVKGEGPNELKGLQDFQIDAEDRLFVLATLGDRTTIYQISEEGELQKLTDTEYLASAFTLAEKDEFYLYGSYNKPLVTHRLVRVDSSGKVLQSYFPNDYTNEMLPMTERNFYETESGDLVLAEIFNDTLYSIQSGEVKTMLNLDLGRFQIPKEFWEMDLMEGYQMIQEQGFAVYKSAFSNSKKIIANIHFQGNEIGTQKKVYLYDRQGGEFQVLDYSEQEAEIWNDPVGLEEDHVWFLTYHSFLKKSENSTLSPELRAKITEQEFDYPILIKAKIN
jgi:uncharacterized protein YwgA